ncbi:MAG TPA: DUF1992 domain-containing protein [Glycomyces sp.]|nr:DUF1992 domain-containing protein [Glycomyces sp.]
MSDRQARGVERAIREAEARGEFTNLPGAGRPLPGLDRPLHEDWWLHQQATRENFGLEMLPPALRLRKEVDDLPAALDDLESEDDVREAVEELNGRIREALIGPVEGPPLAFGPVDTEQAVTDWKRRRT